MNATAATANTANTVTGRVRITGIDVLRGLVMLIMLFDHVREAIYLHVPLTDPLTLEATEPLLLFTRTAAHFCAPIFVFLTGLGAWLYANPAAGPRDATGYLVKRGLLAAARRRMLMFHLYLLLVLQRVLVMVFGANHGDRFGVDDYWLVWLLSVALMPVLYFPCRAFSRYKRRSTQGWVRYF